MFSVITCTASGEEADMMYYNQQGTGIAEPFYPSSPPSPGTGTCEEPVQVVPVMLNRTQSSRALLSSPLNPNLFIIRPREYSPPVSYPVHVHEQLL